MTTNSRSRPGVLACALYLSFTGTVQADKCNYADSSVDKINQAEVVVTERVQLTHWMRELRREMTAYVAASTYGDKTYLQIGIEYVRDRATEAKRPAGIDAISVASGAELMIAMSDGAVLKLPAAKTVVGNTANDDPHPDWFTTRATIAYDLDDSMADALTAQGAKALRVMTDSGHYDVKIHKSNVDDIRKVIRCIRQET